jgi:hypothetical protein
MDDPSAYASRDAGRHQDASDAPAPMEKGRSKMTGTTDTGTERDALTERLMRATAGTFELYNWGDVRPRAGVRVYP